MKQSNLIKRMVSNVLNSMAVIMCVIALGVFTPIVISILLSILVSSLKFQECVTSVPFWGITIISMVVSSVYLSEIDNDK